MATYNNGPSKPGSRRGHQLHLLLTQQRTVLRALEKAVSTQRKLIEMTDQMFPPEPELERQDRLASGSWKRYLDELPNDRNRQMFKDMMAFGVSPSLASKLLSETDGGGEPRIDSVLKYDISERTFLYIGRGVGPTVLSRLQAWKRAHLAKTRFEGATDAEMSTNTRKPNGQAVKRLPKTTDNPL